MTPLKSHHIIAPVINLFKNSLFCCHIHREVQMKMWVTKYTPVRQWGTQIQPGTVAEIVQRDYASQKRTENGCLYLRNRQN